MILVRFGIKRTFHNLKQMLDGSVVFCGVFIAIVASVTQT